ncbi:MAG: hypothetical protein PHY09_05910 [Desulfuromonadaceae bacterium]|nr:hypothetical protein [Desulfuromonadaceae bacterium]MDD5107223.1 hypothetical protein [Desulfuromonadaceae bacterium]
MAAQNCWEYKKCGREKGGVKATELGVCSAFIETRVNGLNNGKNGGRTCWAVTGTLCGGKVQGTFATKLGNCTTCEFFKLVASEEGHNQVSNRDLLAKLKIT